jgi:hypothetical protein
MSEIEIATGKLEKSGVRFRLLVSDRVSEQDLKDISRLIYGAAVKVEEMSSAEGKGAE